MPPTRAASDHAEIATLLHKALDGIAAIDRRVTRTETQNEHIIAEQLSSDASRRVMHEKLDEVGGDLAAARYEIGALDKRVEALDAGFKVLDTIRVKREVLRQFFNRAFRKGWTLGTLGFGAGVWIWHQWETIRDAAARLLK